ncbi:hypothetical protein BS78_K057900 [Paspalum vaginatum]|uniref:Myb/SANT-like domain-containing protein n=1 Tax=Paspalum vaginatum TaxID=158149 RepID=A0A9W8CGL0_9POAL|nr:hypothetical protein BS78_K057900 [Paspalum vaginatum]
MATSAAGSHRRGRRGVSPPPPFAGVGASSLAAYAPVRIHSPPPRCQHRKGASLCRLKTHRYGEDTDKVGLLSQVAMDDLDLNSQAPDMDYGMSFTQLLRSSSPTAIGDAEADVLRGRVGPLPSKGTSGLISGGHGRSVHRVGGVGHAASPSRTKSIGTPAATTMARPYCPPRPSGGSVQGGGGRRLVLGGPRDQASEDNEDGDHVDGSLDYLTEEGNYDKANWKKSRNNVVFCELCVEEIRAGNAPLGFITSRGYKNIADKFYERVGLRHSKLQFKNRWDALKGLYAFWLWAKKQTAVGRTPNGGIVASEEWWKNAHKETC